jgi:hypothetical protein
MKTDGLISKWLPEQKKKEDKENPLFVGPLIEVDGLLGLGEAPSRGAASHRVAESGGGGSIAAAAAKARACVQGTPGPGLRRRICGGPAAGGGIRRCHWMMGLLEFKHRPHGTGTLLPRRLLREQVVVAWREWEHFPSPSFYFKLDFRPQSKKVQKRFLILSPQKVKKQRKG